MSTENPMVEKIKKTAARKTAMVHRGVVFQMS